MIDDRSMQDYLFTVGDPDCFRCLRTLLTYTKCAMEASVLFRKSGVELSRMDEVIGKLSRVGIVSVNRVIVNGRERTIVEFHSHRCELSLLPMLVAAYSHRMIQTAARRSCYGRTEPVIAEL